MGSRQTVRSAAVGLRIAQLREAAGLKQAELARQITWSQAVLSRVEGGERELTEDELAQLLRGIGTPEASALEGIVARQWKHLTAPPLDHRDQELLWAAEQICEELVIQTGAEEIRPAFLRRLQEYQAEVASAAARLLRREHSVAFIGAIGIGKSTAICKALGLGVQEPDGTWAPVLETGAGGITLCEVSLKVGPGYGVIVAPRSADELRADVADWAELLLARTDLITPADDSDDATRGVPRELERAIRNQSLLRPSRTKGPDGRVIRIDPAKKLATQIGSARELTVEILSRMDLPRRDRREAWFDAALGKPPLEWLKETFEQINNGRHPDFSLPARIDLVVPELIDTDELRVNIIDTRGIDRVSARADLEQHLLDEHTVAIFCSGFNDAPAQPIQHLLERARNISNPIIDTNASLLVLVRPGEALAVKDESGIRAESEEEGYELKGEQVSNALAPLGMQELPVEFFNSFGDAPERLRDFATSRAVATREGFRQALTTVIESARELLSDVEQQQVIEVQREAGRLLTTWLNNHMELPEVSGHVHDTLMNEILSAHVSTLNAAVRREGEWYSLSYSHQLGFGARRVAVAALRDWRTEFTGLTETLMVSHPDASGLLGHASRLFEQAYEELLKKMQVAGASLYQEEFQRAQVLWSELADQWGKGAGYRDRVARRQDSWFNERNPQIIEQEVIDLLKREWLTARDRVAAIFDAA